MSETVYAWLLCLFPADFRDAYGKEALELFRDRWRDERGLLLRLRLWGDLLADLAISVPREYRFARVTSSGRYVRPGIPGFHVLERDRISPTFLLLGSVLTALTLGGLTIVSNVWKADYGPFAAVALPSGTGVRDTPAEKVFKAWLLAFNSGDPSAMKTFSKVYDPAGKMSRFVTLRFRTDTGGFQVLSAKNPEPAFIHFRVKEMNGPTRGLGEHFLRRRRVQKRSKEPETCNSCRRDDRRGSVSGKGTPD